MGGKRFVRGLVWGLCVLLLLLQVPVAAQSALVYPAGFQEGGQEASFYQYAPQMRDWRYYNFYAWAHLETDTKWRETDGWSAVYLEDLQEWFWVYHDRQAGQLYHLNRENNVWYLYAGEGTWRFYATEEMDAWTYDGVRAVWMYRGAGLVGQAAAGDAQQGEQGATGNTQLEGQYGDISEAALGQLQQGVDTEWAVTDPTLTYDWETGGWVFDEQYYLEHVTDEQLDAMFENLIASIHDFVNQQTGNRKKTTLMIYMNGTDLESRGMLGSADLRELWQLGSNEDLDIVIKTGGTEKWHTSGIDAAKSQYWRVDPFGISHLQDVGPASTHGIGEAEALTNFIRYAHVEHPADKYILIFWNHGGGPIYGFGHDQHTGDHLSLNEVYEGMRAAKEATGMVFELVGFDACLMATLETARVMQPFAKYFIASEELEPGHGWNYEPMIQALQQNPGIAGDALGRIIIDAYRAYAQQVEAPGWEHITLSLVELAQLEGVMEALHAVVRDLLGPEADFGDANRFARIVHARNRAESYGMMMPMDLVDVWDLADQLRQQGLGEANAQKLQTAVERAVVYAIGSVNNPVAKGLSIYFPAKDTDNFSSSWQVYQDLNFSREYKEFVGKYLSRLMSNRGHRSLAAFQNQPEIVEDERLVKVRFDMQELPKIVDVKMQLAQVFHPQVRWLGEEAALLDQQTGEVVAALPGSWYAILGEYVAVRVQSRRGLQEYAVEVLYNDAPAQLIYRQDGEGIFSLTAVQPVDDSKPTRVVAFAPVPGDTVQFRYGEEAGRRVVFDDLQQFQMTLVPIPEDAVFGYRFLSTDLLGMHTFSEMVVRGNALREAVAVETDESAAPQRAADAGIVDREGSEQTLPVSKTWIIVFAAVVVVLLLVIVALLRKMRRR